MVISKEDKGRASGKTCTACGKEGHFLRHHRKTNTISDKAVSKTDWVRREEMHAPTDLVTNMKDSISAVVNAVTKKCAGGNGSKGSGAPGGFCKLGNVAGHDLQNCRVKTGNEGVLCRFEKIQDTTTSGATTMKAVDFNDEDGGNSMDVWDNREELVDHIRDEAASW